MKNRDFPFGWIFALLVLAFSLWVLTLALHNLSEYKDALELHQQEVQYVQSR